MTETDRLAALLHKTGVGCPTDQLMYCGPERHALDAERLHEQGVRVDKPGDFAKGFDAGYDSAGGVRVGDDWLRAAATEWRERGEALRRHNGLYEAEAFAEAEEALSRAIAAQPAPTLDRERLARALLAALPCEDPEEECDADGRDDHRWCDWCIARAVTVTHAPAIAAAYGRTEP